MRLKISIFHIFNLCCLMLFIPADAASAQSDRGSTSFLSPGKIDLHFLNSDTTNEYNTILWSPAIKGGWGMIDYRSQPSTRYAGAYFRPVIPQNDNEELILGFHQVETATTNSYEIQGEYRLPSGLGFGGGSVSRSDGGSDIHFEKLSFRNRWNEWHYIISTQHQKTGKDNSYGGYAAFYNNILMCVYGNDGEQWRSTLGYIASGNKSMIRPAIEIFYTDNSIGNIDGDRFLFVNATLKFTGGFLSHPSRLGRAMGPTGIEFDNPLGFLAPTWNRRLNTWELGDMVNIRIQKITRPNHTKIEEYEALIYPFQINENPKLLDIFYTGYFYKKISDAADETGVLAGIFGKFEFINIGIGSSYNLETHETKITIGIIHTF